MPVKPSRLCSCGKVVAGGVMCACQIARKIERDKRRPTASARGYDSKWQKARAAFLKQHPNCIKCSAPATVVDHIEPHRGDQKKFWSRSNWQSLCQHHHNSWKQALERSHV